MFLQRFVGIKAPDRSIMATMAVLPARLFTLLNIKVVF